MGAAFFASFHNTAMMSFALSVDDSYVHENPGCPKTADATLTSFVCVNAMLFLTFLHRGQNFLK